MYDLIIENVNNIYPLYEENNRLSKKKGQLMEM